MSRIEAYKPIVQTTKEIGGRLFNFARRKSAEVGDQFISAGKKINSEENLLTSLAKKINFRSNQLKIVDLTDGSKYIEDKLDMQQIRHSLLAQRNTLSDEEINTLVRRKKDWIVSADGTTEKAMQKSVIDKDIVVYRGIGTCEISNRQQALNLVGKTYNYDRFVPTSLDPAVAADGYYTGSQIVFRINVPKGTKGIYMEGLPGCPVREAEEIIMPHNNQVRKLENNEDEILLDKCKLKINKAYENVKFKEGPAFTVLDCSVVT